MRPDPWQSLRQRTPARVALGRAGASLPTAEVLKFSLDHAEARDAVHADFDAEAIATQLRVSRSDVVVVSSRAADHAEYLTNPDSGRQLADASAGALRKVAADGADVAIVLGDGLSATAARQHGANFVGELLDRLPRFSIAPLVVARHARVGLQDPIGHALKARACVIILGERPGLGAADSLGVYLVYAPGPGKSDADRNCVSNVRPAGLPLSAAADTVAYLIDAALSRRISGVTLKDDRVTVLSPSHGTPGEGRGGGLPKTQATFSTTRPPP